MDDISAALLGPPTLNRDEVVAQVDLPLDLVLRLWAAMGFPEVPSGEVAFTERDVQALRDAGLVVASGIVETGQLVALTRSMGQSMSRLAQMHVNNLAHIADDQDEATIVALAEAGVPIVARLLEYVWRRHLAASAVSALDRSDRGTLAVGFVDLVGYTGLSRRLDHAELEPLVEAFDDTVATNAARGGVRVVKTLGDGVLLSGASASQLATVLLAVLAAVDSDPKLPEARAGLSWGPVLQRHGDVYGETVNLASRITGLARPGTLLAEEQAAGELREDDGWQVKAAGAHSVRGYSRLKTWRVRSLLVSNS
ncbi:MAG: adenylate cyclase [Frankiales bacterium]|nr:adenylate cyclase [Frankiales bacterium]